MRLPIYPLGSRILKLQRPWLKGTDVRQLQQALKSLGLMEGRVDGVYGEDTASSVRKFNSLFQRDPRPTFDEASWEALNTLLKEGINRWPTLQRDFTHVGSTVMPVKLSLKPQWKKTCEQVLGLACHRNRLVVVTSREVLSFALNGRLLWKNSKLLPQSAPTLWADKVLIPGGDLEIIHLYTGKRERRFTHGDFRSPVAVSRNTIYAASGGSILAMDADGKILWKFSTLGALATAPTIAYDLIYFSSYDRNLYCLDDTGAIYWKIKTQDIIVNPMACWDSMLFAISQDSWFYALNPLTGKVIWKKQFSAEGFFMPSFRRGLMVAVDYRGRVYFMNPQNGGILGMEELGSVPTTPPLLCEEAIFIGTENGLVGISIEPHGMEHYLSGEKILSVIPAKLGLLVATEAKLIMLKGS